MSGIEGRVRKNSGIQNALFEGAACPQISASLEPATGNIRARPYTPRPSSLPPLRRFTTS